MKTAFELLIKAFFCSYYSIASNLYFAVIDFQMILRNLILVLSVLKSTQTTCRKSYFVYLYKKSSIYITFSICADEFMPTCICMVTSLLIVGSGRRNIFTKSGKRSKKNKRKQK